MRQVAIYSALKIFVVLCSVASANAETRNSVSGDLKLESTEIEEVSPKLAAKKGAAIWIEEVKAAATAGGMQGVSKPSDGTLNYLAFTYLYCNKKLGPCPFVLETILSADLMESRGKGVAECSTMKRFWKAWIDNSLEQRAKFLLSIANATTVGNFNATERPKYLKCQPTVQSLLADPGLSKRFGEKGEALQAITKSDALLKEISSRNLDVMNEVGVSTEKPNKKE